MNFRTTLIRRQNELERRLVSIDRQKNTIGENTPVERLWTPKEEKRLNYLNKKQAEFEAKLSGLVPLIKQEFWTKKEAVKNEELSESKSSDSGDNVVGAGAGDSPENSVPRS